jgi:hypothetical protein
LTPILFYLSKMPESSPMLGKTKNLPAYLDRNMARASVRNTLPPQARG